MSLPRCAARDHCKMPELSLPPVGGGRHFCLHCGLQKHAPCGEEYDGASNLKKKKFTIYFNAAALPPRESRPTRPNPNPDWYISLSLHTVGIVTPLLAYAVRVREIVYSDISQQNNSVQPACTEQLKPPNKNESVFLNGV